MSAAAKLSPQELRRGAAERANAHRASHPHRLGAPPLLTWFIREGDTDLVDMDAIETANVAEDQDRAPARRPRNFRPAREIRADLERVEARLSALVGSGDRHPTTDVAASRRLSRKASPHLPQPRTPSPPLTDPRFEEQCCAPAVLGRFVNASLVADPPLSPAVTGARGQPSLPTSRSGVSHLARAASDPN